MSRHPTIMIPYPGPCLDRQVQDIVIYLRPETNGIRTESCMLKVLREKPHYKDLYQLVYLANLPGDFIMQNHIVEEHYALQVRFAKSGKAAFTDKMKRSFEEYFETDFESADIVGAYEALNRLRLSEEKLFRTWVANESFVVIHRQSVKRIGGVYVVNYDIPALLHRNSEDTDIFAMILRCFTGYKEIHQLIIEMGHALEEANILTGHMPAARVFHYSKGPFEQIRDGIGYIYDKADTHAALDDLSFFGFMNQEGVGADAIVDVVKQPIRLFQTEQGAIEKNIFDYTYECSYRQASDRFASIVE